MEFLFVTIDALDNFDLDRTFQIWSALINLCHAKKVSLG